MVGPITELFLPSAVFRVGAYSRRAIVRINTVYGWMLLNNSFLGCFYCAVQGGSNF